MGRSTYSHNMDEMEVQSNPNYIYPQNEQQTSWQKYVTNDDLAYDPRLDRHVSDFGVYDRHDSGERSMVSGCSAKTFTVPDPHFNSKLLGRKKSIQKHKYKHVVNNRRNNKLAYFATNKTSLQDDDE